MLSSWWISSNDMSKNTSTIEVVQMELGSFSDDVNTYIALLTEYYIATLLHLHLFQYPRIIQQFHNPLAAFRL